MEIETEKKTEGEIVDQLPDPKEKLPGLKIYSQNGIFYWWPVWVTGYIMAALSYFNGARVDTGGLSEYIHPSANLGIIFVLVLMIVIVFTNFSFRGSASVAVVGGIVLVSMGLALLGWWDAVFEGFSYLSIHMNLGFYLFFSSLLALFWLYAVVIHCRFHYFQVRPGQISEHRMVGEGEINYDSRGAVLEKLREDVFRHWILGLGTGDIKLSTTGARSEEIVIRNVLFVDRKISSIRKLISVQPDEFLSE